MNYNDEIIQKALGYSAGLVDKTIIEEKKFNLLSLDELISLKLPEQKFIVEHLVPTGGVTVISGYGAAYKTWFVLNMACCIAQKRSFLNTFETVKNIVLIVDEENTINMVQERMKLLGHLESNDLFFLFNEGIKLDNKQSLEALIKIIEENEIRVVFFDSLVRIHSKNENEAGDMSLVHSKIKEIIRTGATVILTHHHRKELTKKGDRTQALRGSSDIFNMADSVLALDVVDDKVVVTQTKARTSTPLNKFSIKLVEKESYLSFEYEGDYQGAISKSEQLRKRIPQFLSINPGSTTKTLLEHFRDDYGEKVIRETLNLLEQDEVVKSVSRERGLKIWSVWQNGKYIYNNQTANLEKNGHNEHSEAIAVFGNNWNYIDENGSKHLSFAEGIALVQNDA